METDNDIEQLNWYPDEEDVKLKINDPFFDLVFEKPYSDVSQITNNIYITSIGGITKSNFDRYDFCCIIDLCSCDLYTSTTIEHYKIRIWDKITENICHLFDYWADKLHENDSSEKKTVVHCFAGASRSSSIVIAYLMKYHRFSLRDSFNKVRKCRIVARPNNGFFKQLIDYELKLFGKSSAKIVKVRNEGKRLAIEAPDFFLNEHVDIIDKEFYHIERGELVSYYSVPYDD